MKKSNGNVGDIMITGFCLLAMTVLMLTFTDNMQLIQQKAEVSQLARKYILRMGTVGYLTPAEKTALTGELRAIGATEITLEGTTVNEVSYGEPIALQIQGKLREQYDFSEKRVSTAKN